MNFKNQMLAPFRLLALLFAGLILFVQFHNSAHAFEHGFAVEPEQTCEHCLAGHDNENSVAVLTNPEPLQLARVKIDLITQLIYKSHSPSFNHPQSRAPPVS